MQTDNCTTITRVRNKESRNRSNCCRKLSINTDYKSIKEKRTVPTKVFLLMALGPAPLCGIFIHYLSLDWTGSTERDDPANESNDLRANVSAFLIDQMIISMFCWFQCSSSQFLL